MYITKMNMKLAQRNSDHRGCRAETALNSRAAGERGPGLVKDRPRRCQRYVADFNYRLNRRTIESDLMVRMLRACIST